MQNFHLPPTGYGPGSQMPEEDEELSYMALPDDMRTYSAHVPDVSDVPAAALGLLAELAAACDRVAAGGPAESFDLAPLSPAARKVIAETLGEGEVAIRIRGIPALRVQEAVFAGVWAISGAGIDLIEVARIPAAARARAFEPVQRPRPAAPGAGVVNAPALLVELRDRSARPEAGLHVINLTLLPHSEEDLAWLAAELGQGSVDILSRGYGNCRITATALPHVWAVRFYNATEQLILDTYEVTAMPEVALAAPEDLADSAGRIREVAEALR